MVTLSMYDVLGRQVSVLVNERKDAGVHEVKFDWKGAGKRCLFVPHMVRRFYSDKEALLY